MQHQAHSRVLVVEDEAVNRDVVCEMLRHFGHQVNAVDNGRAALRAVKETAYDLVVMDCRMADMDGLETTRRLRAGDAGPRGLTIPVVALTAQAFESDRHACLAAGMNDFLTKPIDLDSLKSAITQWGQARANTSHATPMGPTGCADTPGDAAQVFDRQILAALPMVADGSQPHYAQVVLDMYFKSLPRLLSDIRQAALSGDTKKVQFTAHSLKSSSAAVGALAMAACAAQAEAQLRDGRPDMSHIPSRFDMEFERLCTTLGRQHDTVQKAQYPHAEPC